VCVRAWGSHCGFDEGSPRLCGAIARWWRRLSSARDRCRSRARPRLVTARTAPCRACGRFGLWGWWFHAAGAEFCGASSRHTDGRRHRLQPCHPIRRTRSRPLRTGRRIRRFEPFRAASCSLACGSISVLHATRVGPGSGPRAVRGRSGRARQGRARQREPASPPERSASLATGSGAASRRFAPDSEVWAALRRRSGPNRVCGKFFW
jgi:hypothetical protein